METLYIQPSGKDGVMIKEEEQEKSEEQEEGEMEASSPVGFTTDEETEEDSEPEHPSFIRRKVSFADAFGLDLVSVKEFDNAEVTESEVSQPLESEVARPLEDFYMSCLFTVPSSPEELDRRLEAQMVELESFELLPGTTTIRGIVRVVNLCYTKSVYARMSLDRWTSYFDLMAEYVPGSSDRKTDRFMFKYTLVPPFEREGTRVEICLRYETSLGTFWANNKEMNYVLFCHQKGHVNEQGPQVEESGSYKSRRSCLKAKRRGSAEEKTRESSNTSAVVAEAGATHKAEDADRNTIQYHKEHKSLVDSVKSRHRATRLARVQNHLSQRRQQVSEAYSHDSAHDQKVSPPFPTPWRGSAGFLHKRQEKQTNEKAQVLTYHQIPLLTLDWNNDNVQQLGAAHMDDIWTGRSKMTLSKESVENIEDTPSGNDTWETFHNGTDDTTDKESSVCDVWQAFLNGPSCMDHSGVPESEWLQTAASVSPSNDKEPKTHNVANRQVEFQVGMDTPTTLHSYTSAACQLLTDTCETSLANVALSSADHQSAEACVSSPRDDNTATLDASQRSETNSVTDTPQEFSLKGATPVSEGSVDSSTERLQQAMWEGEREGIIGRAEGIGGDEPLKPHTADFVTSSGESETTDMTATPESQNASAVDRISQGARLAEGLSSSREGQVTGTTHKAMGDTLAFRGTIRQGTKDGEECVFSSRQGVEEGILNNLMENKASSGGEIFKPQKTEKCEISQRYVDEKQCEEVRQNRSSENPLQENESNENERRPEHAHKFNPNQTCDNDLRESQRMANKFKSEESENGDTLNKKDVEAFRKTEVEASYCTTSGETKRLIGVEVETILVLNEEARQHNDKALQLKVHNKQSRPIQAGKEQCIQKENEDSTQRRMEDNVGLKSGEHVLVSNQKREGESLSCDGINEEQQEINPSAQTRHTVNSKEMKEAFQRDHDPFSPFQTDKCHLNQVEVVEMRQTHSQVNMNPASETSPEDVMAKETLQGETKKDTSTELQHQPETLERIEEDMSQREEDERVRIRKLEIEALGELIGNVGVPQGERKNAPAELLAEVESSPHVEYKKLSEGTKDPITAENTEALEVIESGLEKMHSERFGEDLVRGIWEEVFDLKVQASSRDTDVVGELADICDVTQDCHVPFETDFNDAFDSGVFSLTDLDQIMPTKSNAYPPKDGSQPLAMTEQTPCLSESQTDSNSSAHLTTVLAAQSRHSLTESAQSSPTDQENYTQIKERSITRQETRRQKEEGAVTHKESFNRSDHPAHKHSISSSEKLKESDNLVWWSLFYILSHVTRLLRCALLVAGFFLIVFLCDLPSVFALYALSLCWWIYKWKRHQVTPMKGIVG